VDTLQEQIRSAVEILKKGGVVAFPTDTVYGLGVDALNPHAVKRIYEAKRRPLHLPLPLLLSDIAQLNTVAAPVSEIAMILARQFWPGGLTLVLPKATSLSIYSPEQSTIAVRVPNHPVPIALLQRLGNPMTGTSANLSGNPNSLTASEVKQQLGDKVDLIIDAGKCPGGDESTIVDVTGEVPIILRRGIIDQCEIEKALSGHSEVKNDAHCSGL